MSFETINALALVYVTMILYGACRSVDLLSVL